MTEALQKFSLSWRFACWEPWRSLVLVGEALQKLFAVAHLLLRQEKENKLSFYLLLIAKVLLASLETLGYVWVACLGRACLVLVYYRNGQKSQKHYRNFLFLVWCLLGVLEGACIGWRSITEIIRCRSSFATARKRKQAFFLLVLNRKSLSCFARNLGVCMGRLSGGEGAWFCIGGSGLGGFHSFVCFFYYFCHLPMGNALGRGLCGTMRIEPLKMTHLSAFFIS